MRTIQMTFGAAVAAVALAWSAPAAAQATGAGQGQTGRSGQVTNDLRDAIQKLHATNQAEVQLAKSAQSQARSESVKQFARTMEKEHQEGDRKLQQTAGQLGIELEGDAYQQALEDHRKKADELKKRRGEQFDSAFMMQMVDAHDDAIDLVHDAAEDAATQGVPQLALTLGETEGKLHHHHAMAQQILMNLERQQAQAQGQPGQDATGAGEQQGQ
jgi:putative membrane protein